MQRSYLCSLPPQPLHKSRRNSLRCSPPITQGMTRGTSSSVVGLLSDQRVPDYQDSPQHDPHQQRLEEVGADRDATQRTTWVQRISAPSESDCKSQQKQEDLHELAPYRLSRSKAFTKGVLPLNASTVPSRKVISTPVVMSPRTRYFFMSRMFVQGIALVPIPSRYITCLSVTTM